MPSFLEYGACTLSCFKLLAIGFRFHVFILVGRGGLMHEETCMHTNIS